MKPTSATSIAAVLVFATSACASYDHKPVDYSKAESSGHVATLDNVTVSAEAFETEAESTGAFDENLPKAGIIPIQLVVENNTSGDVLILRETVALQDPKGQVYRPVSAVVAAEAVEDNAIAYALLGFGIFSYASAENANDERAADYQTKELEEAKLVIAGRKHGAFVYFKLPEGVDVNSARLKLEVKHVGSNTRSLFDLPLS